MSKILFVNTTQWGRGLTPIWIASHNGLLKKNNHNTDIFDLNFYNSWQKNEVAFNTSNGQYKKVSARNPYKYNTKNIGISLIDKIIEYSPDIIIWSGVSSHIHGEGEFSSVARGYEFVSKHLLSLKSKTMKIPIIATGGIELMAHSKESLKKTYPDIDCFLLGDSEYLLLNLANIIDKKKEIPRFLDIRDIERNRPNFKAGEYYYDYGIFEAQSFIRPYQGKYLKSVDYELSRGCPFSCHYCVETIIQEFYSSRDYNKKGIIKSINQYYRKKEPQDVSEELKHLNSLGIEFIRFQDTNFLSLGMNYLDKISYYMSKYNLKGYIETRPETITKSIVKVLNKLNIVGVGMGIETASNSKRGEELGRHCEDEKIIKAFDLLKKGNIRRTAYNMIGLPDEKPEDIVETIKFNRLLKPDDITCAFYTPYIGTTLSKSFKDETIDRGNLDPQLECPSENAKSNPFYLKMKNLFCHLCKNDESLDFIPKLWKATVKEYSL